MKEFEIAWEEFSKSGKIVRKRKAFDTQEKLEKYIDKLVEKDNFYTILATRG